MAERVAMLCLHSSPLDQPGTGSSGGMNVYVRALAHALGAADVEVDIFTRAAQDLRIVEDASNVRVIEVPAGPRGPVDKSTMAALVPECLRAIEAVVTGRRWTYDVVHSHYWISGLVAAPLAARWSVPMVHMFHTLSRAKTRFAQSTADPRRARGEQRVIDAADAVVVANSLEHAHVRELYRVAGTRLVTIPCGIDPTPFVVRRSLAERPNGATADRFVVAALGRAERLKNFALLLHAVARASAREPRFGPAVELRLAGGPANDEPEVLPELEQLAAALGIADRVRFLGPVLHERVPELYAAADVCVVLSRYESFGLVALEAMAAGLPVVATRVGGLQLTVEDGVNGYLVEPEDSNALAERLLALWASPALRTNLGRRGMISAQQYAWPVVAERMRCLYEALTIVARSASA